MVRLLAWWTVRFGRGAFGDAGEMNATGVTSAGRGMSCLTVGAVETARAVLVESPLPRNESPVPGQQCGGGDGEYVAPTFPQDQPERTASQIRPAGS
ncbi:hypothetical protein ABZ797_09955 [Streptomyces antimycoticus]|uniref:hypothetical protein n=1 Tax=Streptomyces antimycoticus TaxID=68175 RepID=UPI0033FF7E74